MSEFLFGGEFEYDEKEDLNVFINNLKPTVSHAILEMALNHANKQGAFSILESHCIYKCLEKLKDNENKKNHIHNDDIDGDSN
jgi:hypothetical protein